MATVVELGPAGRPSASWSLPRQRSNIAGSREDDDGQRPVLVSSSSSSVNGTERRTLICFDRSLVAQIVDDQSIYILFNYRSILVFYFFFCEWNRE